MRPQDKKVQQEMMQAMAQDAKHPSTAPGYGAWQPMATSPEEPLSRAIIYAPSLFPGESGVVGEAFFGRDGFWYWAGCEEGYHESILEGNAPPEKWMPLPDAP